MGKSNTTNTIKISVRNLVEFVLRAGDLDTRFMGTSRAVEGTKAHKKLQKAAGENYNSEVKLTYIIQKEKVCIELGGRADVIIIDEEDVIIDEIKTTTRPLEYIDEDYNILHWAQAKCYAFIYAEQNQLKEIGVQVTYYQLDTQGIKRLNKEFTIEELKEFFDNLVAKYLEWANIIQNWSEVRDNSIKETNFPFGSYRKGQRELAVGTYTTIKEGKKLFAQAPTGIGKTIATIFPSVKALGEGKISKIFYLTAKTITRTIAEKAFNNLRKGGLKFKTLTLTAKDKICFNPGTACNPESCEYAKGHFDRVNDAITDILQVDSFNRDIIVEHAKKHHICPFEFSLDLVFWSDAIICDYNYVFDPRVYLKRLFMDVREDYGFLIDEAHNLVDRSREMYSAELFKKPMLDLKRKTKDTAPEVSKSLNKLNSFMVQGRKLCEEADKSKFMKKDMGFHLQKEQPQDIYPLLRNFIKEAEEWLLNNPESEFRDELLEFYFEAMAFIRTSETYDERYITYYEKISDDVKIKLFCLDPSELLKEAMKRGKASVLFSATLTPVEYFMKILGGEEDSYKLKLQSPFPQENLCLLIDDKTSTKYKDREFTYDRVTKVIEKVFKNRRGNYLVFLPSYKYMEEIYLRFLERNSDNDSISIIKQRRSMTEAEKEEFLVKFEEENNNTLVGFAVMGGIFGEGIDLTGDKLNGAVIIGVGLPQICFERNIIRDFFDKERNMGFEYAYVYPGMNKVMQAVGRVIRTEEDRGVVMLIDDRFSYGTYKNLFPQEWSHAVRVRNLIDTESRVEDFWNK